MTRDKLEWSVSCASIVSVQAILVRTNKTKMKRVKHMNATESVKTIHCSLIFHTVKLRIRNKKHKNIFKFDDKRPDNHSLG